jgi:hypothetical protein
VAEPFPAGETAAAFSFSRSARLPDDEAIRHYALSPPRKVMSISAWPMKSAPLVIQNSMSSSGTASGSALAAAIHSTIAGNAMIRAQ